ncbi:MAG: excalibur calcium-binding domain-containing protein [Pseudomonadota bacterium]
MTEVQRKTAMSPGMNAVQPRKSKQRVNTTPLADKILETVPSLVNDLQSLVVFARSTPLDLDVRESTPEVRRRAAQSLNEAMSTIRTLVDDHDSAMASEPNAAPEAKAQPAVDLQAQAKAEALAKQRARWSHLREALNSGPEEDSAAPAAAPEAKAPLFSPIDLIRARTLRSSGDVDGSADGAEAEDMPQRDWDSPKDHVMSRRGKSIWTVAVYGSVLTAFVMLFFLSPFAPKATVQHYAAAFGCGVAKTVGVDGAREGAPGYHASLDDNSNGIACEPEITRSALRGGGAFQSAN